MAPTEGEMRRSSNKQAKYKHHAEHRDALIPQGKHTTETYKNFRYWEASGLYSRRARTRNCRFPARLGQKNPQKEQRSPIEEP
jgi:hypothetical protein